MLRRSFRSFRFGDLQPGELFLYLGQTFKKESDQFAELLQLPDGDSLEEYVSHHFEPRTVVIPLDFEGGFAGGGCDETLTSGNCVHV